jgi:hypothetical protein
MGFIIRMPEESRDDTIFAHPIEEEFAKLLDYYHIEWQYEPRTFVLARGESGNIIEAFSPDFYLPGQDLYIELTTMRPKLITRKNRKLRRLRELYPHINIKLFNRQDLRNMMIKYGLDDQAAAILGTQAQDDDK